jgi:hypothetical protein
MVTMGCLSGDARDMFDFELVEKNSSQKDVLQRLRRYEQRPRIRKETRDMQPALKCLQAVVEDASQAVSPPSPTTLIGDSGSCSNLVLLTSVCWKTMIVHYDYARDAEQQLDE